MSSIIPQTSGIYKITCTPTGKVYIGSSVNMYQRWHSKHLPNLRTDRHENSYLQRAWNKYGESAFTISVIELVLAPFLLEREQYWIDRLQVCNRRKGFNISLKAGAPMAGRKHSAETVAQMRERALKFRHSEETKRMMSERNKGKRFGHHTTESIRKRSEAVRGRKHTQETKDKIRAARMARNAAERTYIVTFPDGHEETIVNLHRFCREHGLHDSGMFAVAGRHQKQHRGYKCRYPDWVERPKPKSKVKSVKPDGRKTNKPSIAARSALVTKLQKAYILTDPYGVEHRIVNLNQFCREHDLDAATLHGTMRSERRQHKGWKCRREID